MLKRLSLSSLKALSSLVKVVTEEASPEHVIPGHDEAAPALTVADIAVLPTPLNIIFSVLIPLPRSPTFTTVSEPIPVVRLLVAPKIPTENGFTPACVLSSESCLSILILSYPTKDLVSVVAHPQEIAVPQSESI